MELIVIYNTKSKNYAIKHPAYGRSQYTSWLMLKSFYKREFGISLPSKDKLDFKYVDMMEVERYAKVLV